MTKTPLEWKQLLSIYTYLIKTAKKIPLRDWERDLSMVVSIVESCSSR